MRTAPRPRLIILSDSARPTAACMQVSQQRTHLIINVRAPKANYYYRRSAITENEHALCNLRSCCCIHKTLSECCCPLVMCVCQESTNLINWWLYIFMSDVLPILWCAKSYIIPYAQVASEQTRCSKCKCSSGGSVAKRKEAHSRADV